MDPIDLRSDTVTRPTKAMRAAMADAEVGDDVYGEDPSVNRLEQLAAERLGKEAALFVPSGTMANQLALRSLTRHGDQVLAGENAHVLLFESGAAAALWGLQIQTIGTGGLFDDGDVHRGIPPRDDHYAPATALAIENTHNVSGGRVWPMEQLERVSSAARQRGLRIHLDGARVFNAACTSKTSVEEIAGHADTVSFCLSKGLGAPVGSLVCGERDRVREMRRFRKMLGGGMRQAGVLAAAGLHALEHHVDRLQEDHDNAGALAAGLVECGLEVGSPPESNIVNFRVPEGRFPAVPDAAALSRAARERELLVSPTDRMQLRAVTHLDVGRKRITDALDRIRRILR
jgi:threonine aldolase